MSFKPFINIASPTGNVVFNFRGNPIRDLGAFASGYRKAATALATAFNDNAYADYEGYPVLYLYRHSLELYLKAVVYRGAELMGLIGTDMPVIEKLFQHHGLVRLMPAVRAIFKAMKWDFEGTEFQSFDKFAAFVESIESIDPGSYAFRYPINPAGEAHLPHHFTVNVPNFSKVMNATLGYLEGAADLLLDTFQSEAEARYELEQLMAQDEN
jgi:hypothetical protein